MEFSAKSRNKEEYLIVGPGEIVKRAAELPRQSPHLEGGGLRLGIFQLVFNNNKSLRAIKQLIKVRRLG